MSLRLPTATEPTRSWYYGAYVFPPKEGRWRNVVYPDLSSLYPNRMRGSNLSPETLVGDSYEDYEFHWSDIHGDPHVNGLWTEEEWWEMDWTEEPLETTLTEDQVVWSYYDPRDVKRCENHEDWQQYRDPEQYKAVRWKNSKEEWKLKWKADPRPEKLYFLKPSVREGFVRETVEEMLGLKEQYRGTDKYEAVKRIVNSTYGVFGYASEHNSFRLFDWRLAESITLSGRMVIQHTAEEFVDYLNDEYEANATLVGGDTDSVMTAIEGASTRDEAVRWAIDAAEYVNGTYDEFCEETFGQDEHFMELEIESYSPTLYMHHMKKRYAPWVTWEDGEDLSSEVDEDSIYYGTNEEHKKAVGEFGVKGFEATRSDISDLTEETQLFVLETILKEKPGAAKQLVYEHIRETIRDVREGNAPLETMGVRSGIGKPLDQYGGPDRRPSPLIRGAKYANQYLGTNIGEGSKPMRFPVKRLTDPDLPKTYRAETAEDGDVVDYISVEDTRTIDGKVKIDHEKVITKQIRDPVEDILENVGWEWYGVIENHEQSAISGYM